MIAKANNFLQKVIGLKKFVFLEFSYFPLKSARFAHYLPRKLYLLVCVT